MQEMTTVLNRETVYPYPWCGPFLEALSETGSVRQASAMVGVSDNRARALRRTDETFQAGCAAALESHADRVYEEVWRRGVNGIDKPLTFRGVPTGRWVDRQGNDLPERQPGARWQAYTVREYDTPCLLALAKHHGIGKDHPAASQPALDVSPEQLAILRQLADYAASRKAGAVQPAITPSADGLGASQDAPR